MATHHLFTFLLLLFTTTATTTTTTIIQQACHATLYPTTCQTTLKNTPIPSTPLTLLNTTLSLTSHHLITALSLISTLHNHPNHNLSSAATTCSDHLASSHHRILTTTTPTPTPDSRAFTSASLTYQYDCLNELSYVNLTTPILHQTMSFLNSTLLPTTSIALSFFTALYNYGDDVSNWAPPKTERDGFWERVDDHPRPYPSDSLGFDKSFDNKKKWDAVVCKEAGQQVVAGGCYGSVQKAVDAAPAGLMGKDRFVIYIKEGVYEEIVRVPLEKSNLVFLGDGKGKTVITGKVNTGIMGITTYNTATVGVKGDGFIARDITFQNTAGPEAHQAVAFRSDSDLSLVENCEFLGHQDTLWVHSLRQVYRSCHIEGNVDFIFGNAAALLQDCTILIRPRELDPTKGENNAVTAQGRTDPSESTGLVFLGCLINGTEEYVKLWKDNPKVHKNFLGRPWKMYSRTVFIDCTMEEIISGEGWMTFRDDFALSTLYYGEFGNKGPGADLSRRVKWSSQIPEGHVNVYSARNFIQADEWDSVL